MGTRFSCAAIDFTKSLQFFRLFCAMGHNWWFQKSSTILPITNDIWIFRITSETGFVFLKRTMNEFPHKVFNFKRKWGRAFVVEINAVNSTSRANKRDFPLIRSIEPKHFPKVATFLTSLPGAEIYLNF